MRRPWMLGAVLVLAGCADEVPQQDTPEPVEAPSPAGDFSGQGAGGEDLSPGTPAEGYVAWIADLRSGLARVESLALTERETALRMVQDLYASRLEYLERYFGGGGMMYVSDGMARAVDRSAAEFQSLMEQLAGVDDDPARLADTVRAADQALYDIEAEGQAAGLRPTAPHRDD
jgi:hypothetical protein